MTLHISRRRLVLYLSALVSWGLLSNVVPATAGDAKRILWGDTHLHTSLSADVYMFGTFSSTAETAYNYAKGLVVENPATGQPAQIAAPLDFLVVADHAEMLGTFEGCLPAMKRWWRPKRVVHSGK